MDNSIPNEKKNKAESLGKKIGNIDKATGGKAGRVAKPLNDSGAIDTANKSMDVAGGKLPDKNLNRSLNSHPSNNQTPGLNQKPNFAKNGINNDNNLPNGNSEGANKSRLREFFSKKKGIKNVLGFGGNKKNNSLFNKKDENPNDINYTFDMAAEGVKNLIKKSLIPFVVFLVLIFFIMAIIVTENNDKIDVAGGDYMALSNGVEGDDEEQNNFYLRVEKVRQEYQEKGKNINSMYITATFHILNRKDSSITYEKITEEVIKKFADGMLGDSTIYSKETYAKFLIKEFTSNGT